MIDTMLVESTPRVVQIALLADRELVEYYTSSIARFNSLGWSGPYNEDDLKGWKIGGFGCNSPLYHAGLQRGDIILTVNDRPASHRLVT